MTTPYGRKVRTSEKREREEEKQAGAKLSSGIYSNIPNWLRFYWPSPSIV
jgi:hypothetical protein